MTDVPNVIALGGVTETNDIALGVITEPNVIALGVDSAEIPTDIIKFKILTFNLA